MLPRLGKLLVDRLYAGDKIKFRYNPESLMVEMWGRYYTNKNDWVLVDAFPSMLSFFEEFVSGIVVGTDLDGNLAIALENAWNVNGNRGGGAPTIANFDQSNAELVMKTTAAATDWIAIHTGKNYPYMIHSDRPRATFVIREVINSTDIHFLMGLVGSAGLETGSGAVAWTTPDDGIWVEYDSAVDTHMRFVTRKEGVSTTTDIGELTGESWEASFNTNDEGNKIDCLKLTLLASHTTNIPDCTLKPIFLLENRGAAARSMNPSFALVICVGET